MTGQIKRLKIKRHFERIPILLIAIVFSMAITSQILVPVLKKVKKAQENMKVLEKSIAKVTDKSAMTERRKDNFVLTPPRLEKDTFLHYLKATKEWGEYLERY